MFEVAAFRSAITTLEGNYTVHSVLAANLQTLSAEVTKLNARLALDDVFENADEIKQTITDADALVSRIDLADPLVTVDDAEKSAAELESLKASLGIALDNYGLSHAVVGAERIELATPTYTGTVGDTLGITAAVYPTMVKDTTLTYTTSNAAVVTVNDNGGVVLTGAGTADIVVTDAASGVQTSMTVTSKAATVAAKPQTPPAPAQAKPSGGVQTPQTPPAQAKPGAVDKGDITGENITNEAEERQHWSDLTDGKADSPAAMADLSREELRELFGNLD